MRMSSRRVRLLGLLVALALTVSIGVAGTTAATNGQTVDGATQPLLGDVTGELPPTADGLVSVTNETTGDLVETTNETSGDLVSATNETTGDLVETTNETVETATGTVNETLDSTSDGADGVVESTTGTVGGTITTALVVDGTALDTELAVEAELAVGSENGTNGNESTTGNDAGESDDSPMSPGGASDAASVALTGLMGLTALTSAGAGGAGGAAGAGGAGAGASASLTSGGFPGRTALRRAARLLRTLPVELSPISILRYSRYDDSDPLDHEVRRTIHETIEAEPGLYLSAVSERTDTALSTVRHHVRVLEEEGLLSSAKVNGKRRYVPAADDDVELYAALDDPPKRRVLEALATTGPASNARIAEELDVDPSTVSHHLSTLEGDGLVVRERDGRTIVTRLAPPVASTLVEESKADAARNAPAPADD